ncbi:MAG: aminopeptidase P family protein [Oscillochloris sp.]|nr:aminopeptidase P family protein [Oscillochloris sp.]
MHNEQRERAQHALQARKIERALFAARASVLWLSGFAPPVNLGPNPFAGGPPLIWYAGGTWTLLVMESQAADAATSGLPLVTYPDYTIAAPITSATNLAAVLRETTAADSAKGPIGVELHDCPAALANVLPAGSELTPIDGRLEPLRRRKTAEELALLRRNFALVAEGQRAGRAAVKPGNREIDVWNAVESAIQAVAGRRVAVGNDCTVGYRDMNIGGWPLDLALRPGDSFILDLSTQYGGYWSDSCATYYAGEPSARQIAMHNLAAAALELAIDRARPGAVSGAIDAEIRRFIADAGYPVYPHHTGHGIGVTPHEEPRIVPYNRLVLEPGMVVMLEPGIYLPGETAVRLEHAVLITDGAPEVLTSHRILLC